MFRHTSDDGVHCQVLQDGVVSTIPLLSTEQVSRHQLIALLIACPQGLSLKHPPLRHLQALHHKCLRGVELLLGAAVAGQGVLYCTLGEGGVLEVEQDKDGPRPLARALQLTGKAGEELRHGSGVHVGVAETAQQGPHHPAKTYMYRGREGRGGREGGREGGGREGREVKD